MYDVKKCDLDLSVEWFQLLFRKIELTVVGTAMPLWAGSYESILLTAGKILPFRRAILFKPVKILPH